MYYLFSERKLSCKLHNDTKLDAVIFFCIRYLLILLVWWFPFIFLITCLLIVEIYLPIWVKEPQIMWRLSLNPVDNFFQNPNKRVCLWCKKKLYASSKHFFYSSSFPKDKFFRWITSYYDKKLCVKIFEQKRGSGDWLMLIQ